MNSAVELKYSFGKDIPQKLIGDPTRLNQILYNLLENAYRNTTEGTIHLHISLNEMVSKEVAS